MANRYLLHFAHEHVPFRWTEFLALTHNYDCKFKLISDEKHLQTRPFIFVELDDGSPEESLLKSVRASYCLKDLYEVWAESSISLEDLAIRAESSPHFKSRYFSGSEHRFRVNCESFGSKLAQPTKVEMIKKMKFLDTFEAKADLTNPRQIYCIFEMNERKPRDQTILSKEYYFGRHLARSDRASIDKFSLKRRAFIANTSMDPMLSLISANVALVRPNDLVFDPFVGSGSLMVAAAYKGAYIFGGDIDWKLLHGQSRPSRKGQKRRDDGECVRANMIQYKLVDRYIDVMVSDITRSPLAVRLKLDAIISDPPYGVRECCERIGVKKKAYKPLEEGKTRYPSKIDYKMTDILADLLTLSARHLKLGGRLVYFLPLANAEGNYDAYIPRHPCLKLISHCEQYLTGKVFRLLIVMEKKGEPKEGDYARVPETITEMNLRETYFTSRYDSNVGIKCDKSHSFKD